MHLPAQSLFDDAEDEKTTPEENQMSTTCCMRKVLSLQADFQAEIPRLGGGLNAKQAEYAVKKYRSHRRVGAGIMMVMVILSRYWY